MMPYTLVTLRADRDAVRLQRLLERCSDYYELHEGWATPPDAGEYELTLDSSVLPKSASLLVLALEEESEGPLHAVAQVLVDAPEPGTWWIGLLIVAPELRSHGIGSDVVRQTLASAAAAGARTVKLAVSLSNPRGQRFWERAGFRDTGTIYSVTARSGHGDQGRVMVQEVSG